MKYTLFHNDYKIKMVRTKEFPMVFFVYDDVKEKGNKLYKKKKNIVKLLITTFMHILCLSG